MIQYEKVEKSMRIDWFDASVFKRCRQMLEDSEKSGNVPAWLNGGRN